MMGAVQRLKEYANISTCPMTTRITKFTRTRHDMWMYTLKNWMEEKDITIQISRNEHNIENTIMDANKREQCGKEIWEWTRQNKIRRIENLINRDGTWREDIWNEKMRNMIRSQISNVTKNRTINKINKTKYSSNNRWIQMHDNDKIGHIQKNKRRNTLKHYYRVQTWERKGRKWHKNDSKMIVK